MNSLTSVSHKMSSPIFVFDLPLIQLTLTVLWALSVMFDGIVSYSSSACFRFTQGVWPSCFHLLFIFCLYHADMFILFYFLITNRSNVTTSLLSQAATGKLQVTRLFESKDAKASTFKYVRANA